MAYGPDYQFLRSIPVFMELPDKDFERLVSRMKKKKFRAGEYFFYQDDKVDHFYILEMGSVEIYKSDINGKKLTLWFIEGGDLFCLANMFAERSFANALAQTDCLAYTITKKNLLEILSVDHNLSIQFINCLSSKLAAYSSLLEDFTFKNVKARLAKLLLRFLSQDEEKRMTCALTQGEMASLLGTCREVVSRNIKVLRKEGLVDLKPSGKTQIIYILKPDRLKKIGLQDDG